MDELTSVDLTLFSNVEMVFFGLLGSVCHKDDGQGTDRDTQTGLAGKGCIFCSLWSVQRSSAARHNVLELHFLGETMRREEVWGRVFFVENSFALEQHWWLQELTLHAYKQQVGCQLAPVPLGLLFVDPVPVETKKVNDYLFSYCVIQSLL